MRERSIRMTTLPHGHSTPPTRTYSIWNGMRMRCLNPRDKDYPRYGGRGIKVYSRWEAFACFLDDMGECPAGYSIERKNNADGYYPHNCSWIPLADQKHNRRSNKLSQEAASRIRDIHRVDSAFLQKNIAKYFSVSDGTVAEVLTGKIWKEISNE